MSLSETVIMTAANMSPTGVDIILKKLALNDTIYKYLNGLSRKTLDGLDKIGHILIVSDTNIGDAVVLQTACSVLKHHFPECNIDYTYQRRAQPLICKNPFIHKDLPVFVDTDFTSKRNSEAIKAIVTENNYDLIINLYPFLLIGELTLANCPVIVPYKLIANIIRAQNNNSEKTHVLYQLNQYINNLVYDFPRRVRSNKAKQTFFGNTIYLPKSMVVETKEILRVFRIFEDMKIAFLNPDTSSRYSVIPIGIQVEFIEELLSTKLYDLIILGPGFTFQDIEKELYQRIPKELKTGKLVVLPKNIPIEVYTGLIDRSDLFITGDTAQMHIAAARKVCVEGEYTFRNKTALICIFGATNSMIHGYDSFSKKHLDSTQQEPAKVFEGNPECRNLTCIHKTRKKCNRLKCFDGLQAGQIIEYISNYLN